MPLHTVSGPIGASGKHSSDSASGLHASNPGTGHTPAIEQLLPSASKPSSTSPSQSSSTSLPHRSVAAAVAGVASHTRPLPSPAHTSAPSRAQAPTPAL